MENNIIREQFKLQLKNEKVITEELLPELKSKIYHNGDKVQVGDVPLIAFTINGHEEENMYLSSILIKESQIDLYELDNRKCFQGNPFIPIIKLK